METMTPMDFLDFRDKLRPASGFQSWQFKLLEARLGLKYEHRYGQEYYLSQLRQPEIDRVRSAEREPSLLQLLNSWLERMPFPPADMAGAFWEDYRQRYQQSLTDAEKGNLAYFDAVLAGADGAEPRSLSPAACRAAVFIMLYRGYPLLQLPFQVLHQLLEIDEQLSTWRFRHMSMVHRMIGTRIGTGGSTGKDYLGAALQRHHLFKEIAALTSFLIERQRLPVLSPEMERRMGFL
jgi:tryptophan 2,3-dioxygenase